MKGDQPVSEQSTDVGGSHAQRLPSAKVIFMYILSCVDVLTVYFVEYVSYYVYKPLFS